MECERIRSTIAALCRVRTKLASIYLKTGVYCDNGIQARMER